MFDGTFFCSLFYFFSDIYIFSHITKYRIQNIHRKEGDFYSFRKKYIQPRCCHANAGNSFTSINTPMSGGGPELLPALPLLSPLFLLLLPFCLTVGSKTDISCYLKALNTNFQIVICQSALAFQH
jgi:hypothetical protein